MTDFHPCKINFKKRELARLLEERDGVSWSFNPSSHFDPFVHLKAAIPEPVTIKANSTLPIPTGITPELNNPNFKLQITTLSQLAIDKGIIVLDSPATIDFSFRGEIWVMLHNISNKSTIIRTGQQIAQMSIEPVIRMNIDYKEEVDTKNVASLGLVKWIKDFINNRSQKDKLERQSQEIISKEKILKEFDLHESENDELESNKKS